MKNRGIRLFFAIFICLAIVLPVKVTAQEETAPPVTAIEVQGVRRIEPGAIRQKISQKVGEPLSGEKIASDIKKIYEMGYFDDVKAETEFFEGGVKVIFIVKEKPTIVKVAFEGNKEFDDEKLKEKITIVPGAIADVTLIQDNVAALRSFYESEGYWRVKIVPVVRKITENESSLTFVIEEGSKVRIRDIIIEGNSALSDRKIKKVMKTKEWWIFSFITKSGYYEKGQMRLDLESIRELYLNNGYLEVKVAEPVIKPSEDGKKLDIIIKVSEGPQYKVDNITFRGHRAADEKKLRELIGLKKGDIFSKGKLSDGIKRATEFYAEKGYAMASIEPGITTDEKAHTASVIMNISEGDIFYIGRIEVIGNTKTLDKVIRREIRFNEGDRFNGKLLKRSYERINNLNFFETVELVPKPHLETKTIDIDVKVKEKATGFLSVGGGYSTVDKLVGIIDLTQANLFGTGRYIKLKAELGGSSSFYELSYRDPWFMDKPISMTLSAYKTQRDFVSYDRNATGGSIGFGKRFREYWSAGLTYRFERATVENVSDTASNIVKDQIGTKITSSITGSITRDSRDSYIDPSKGTRHSLVLTYAGIGGDNYFVKGQVDSAWFFPIGSSTISLRGRVGYIKGLFGHEIPLYERFYVGGIYTIRGLGFGEGGPRDETGEVIGGTSEVILNAEYIFPIFQEAKLKGVVFLDAGRAYDDSEDFLSDIRYTAGGGIRWLSPFGPVRIEYGFNLSPKEDEESGKIEFAFGSFF